MSTATRSMEHSTHAAAGDERTEAVGESLIPVQSRVRNCLDIWLPPIVALMTLIGAWIGLIRWKHTPPVIAPSPGDIINATGTTGAT